MIYYLEWKMYKLILIRDNKIRISNFTHLKDARDYIKNFKTDEDNWLKWLIKGKTIQIFREVE